MKNYLLKELKLCLSPINYIFLSFVFMIIIPNYPCYVTFFYIGLSIFFMFNNAEINKDIQYSMILPITKKDIVKSRCLVIALYEILSIILTLPFAFLSKILNPAGNLAGIEANVGFYGLLMIVLTAFHYVMLTKFYKKAEKPGSAFLLAAIVFWILYIVFEFCHEINIYRNLHRFCGRADQRGPSFSAMDEDDT